MEVPSIHTNGSLYEWFNIKSQTQTGVSSFLMYETCKTGSYLMQISSKSCWFGTGFRGTWCKELTHWKRPWCWERLKAKREEGSRGWDGWMASPVDTNLSKLWEIVKDREAWHTAVHGVTRVRLDLVTEHQQKQQRMPKSAEFSCLWVWIGD